MVKLFTIFVTSGLALSIAAPVEAQTASAGVSPFDAASKLVGASVYTVQGENVGSIVRVMPPSRAGEPTAVLSLNQNIGRGTQLVAVPRGDIRIGAAGANAEGADRSTVSTAAGNEFNWLAGGGG